MKSSKMTDKAHSEFERSSGNIFADLGLENAEELYMRGLIGCHVVKLLTEKQMKQQELAALLQVKQAEISHLMNGHFDRFTTDKLLDFLRRLEHKVTIQISPHKQDEPYQEVAFAL